MGSDYAQDLDYSLSESAQAEMGARSLGDANTLMILAGLSALTTAVVTVGRILLDRLPERKESYHAD
jgi:hypothetical protein